MRGLLLVAALGMFGAWPGTPAAAEDEPAASGPFRLGGSVVVGASASAVYLPDPGSGLIAVHPKTGEVLWRSAAAVRPLWIREGRLVAQAEGSEPGILSLAVLDSATGALVFTSKVATAPGVVLGPWEDRSRRFDLEAHDVGPHVVVRWWYQELPAIPVERATGDPARVEGAVRIDLAAKAAAAIDAASVPLPAGPALPPRVQAFVDANPWGGTPFRAADAFVLPERRKDDTGTTLVALRRWRAASGEDLPEVVLPGDAVLGMLPSPDGRHLLLTRTHQPVVPGIESHDWEIRALPSGDRLAKVVQPFGATAPFCVVDGVLLHETLALYDVEGATLRLRPPHLVAVELATGTERWRRPLRGATSPAGEPSAPAPPR